MRALSTNAIIKPKNPGSPREWDTGIPGEWIIFKLSRDLFDLDRGQVLTMADGPGRVLALAVLVRNGLGAAGMADHLCLDLHVLEVRLADLDLLTVGKQQNFFHGDLLSGRIVQTVGGDGLAFAHLELEPA